MLSSDEQATPALYWSALLVLVAAVSVPFLGKAFHIDDPFFLRISANVLQNPLDPFAGAIDWGGVRRPVWELASNPPLLSYYLAPFLWLGEGREWVLQLGMLPFLLLFALATHSLASRFTLSPWLVVWLVMTSAAVCVGLNLMRDIPATALGLSAVALVIRAADGERPGLLWLGFGLAGLALLTRFNAILFTAAAAGYLVLCGRPRALLPLVLPAGMLALYSLHNSIVYGEPQLLAQLGRGHNRPFHAWRDNLASLCVIVGSISYLAPALLLRAVQRREWLLTAALVAFCTLVLLAVTAYLGPSADTQYWGWSLVGALALGAALVEGLRGQRDARTAQRRDSLFLWSWLVAQLLFGVLVAPYPAVRHLLPALVPLCLLGLRHWERDAVPGWLSSVPIGVLIALQGAVSLAVAVADRDLANSHRDFAAEMVSALPEAASGRVWFIGSWGWLYYAEQAGFRQLHARGEGPAPGDLLVIPHQVDQGMALLRRPELQSLLVQRGQRDIGSLSPFRTVHDSGAGFYALLSGRNTERRADVPYRWLPGTAVEHFGLYEVAPD